MQSVIRFALKQNTREDIALVYFRILCQSDDPLHYVNAAVGQMFLTCCDVPCENNARHNVMFYVFYYNVGMFYYNVGMSYFYISCLYALQIA